MQVAIAHFCDYCDVYLTHDSMSVRKAHNSGRNHLRNVVDYYQPRSEIGHERQQSVIDAITQANNEAGTTNHIQGPPPGVPGMAPPFGAPGGFPMPPGMPGPPPPGGFSGGFPGGPRGPAGSPGQGMPFNPPPGMPSFPPNMPNMPFPPPVRTQGGSMMADERDIRRYDT
ncbi:hypothetical protein ANO11243_036480 [Dothideomycetidae sp. 11243]|nr:hypothetical protein ANO11243_036480 [fungal sp. No.11243]